MSEKLLVAHCAPTLAGLKTGNLFSYRFESKEALFEQYTQWNEQLNQKDVYIEILKVAPEYALIYVYRRRHLEIDLSKPQVRTFLGEYGYTAYSIESCIQKLKERLKEREEFPHEIGLFLSYPLEDVVGFIANCGQNCKCIGCWKVYCDEAEATRRFEKYKKCKCVYARLYKQGRSIMQLTVAAS